MEAAIRAVPLSIVFALLGACGGGGGGGGGGVVVPGPTAIEVPFASFAAIAPNQTVIMDGTAVTASGNQTIAGNGEVTITSADLNPAGAATVSLSYDGSRELKGMSVSTPNSSVSFNRDTPGHSISCDGVGTCLAQSPTASAVAADAVALGWNYQSYGVWANDLSGSSWVAGAVSAGRTTPGSAIPTTGNAIFNGVASGFYFDPNGTPFATAASMRADVNFSGQSIGFSTSNTTLVNTSKNSGVPSPDGAGLNLTGNFSYAKGINAFSGQVNTANGQLGGQGSGRFYGPAAEEIGGVYSLSAPTGVSRMIGGFGGKR